MTREEAIEILRAKAVDIPIGWETFQRAQGVKVKTIRRGTLWRAIRWWGDTQNVNTRKHKGGEKHDYTY